MICGSGIKNSKQLRAKSRFESSQTTFADFFPFLSFCRFIFFMTNDYLRSNLIFWELLEGKIFGRKKKICLVLHSGKMARLRFLSLNAFSNLMERERERERERVWFKIGVRQCLACAKILTSFEYSDVSRNVDLNQLIFISEERWV